MAHPRQKASFRWTRGRRCTNNQTGPPDGGTPGATSGGKVPVAPKYRHPENPALTWSGRGRKPKWFVEALEQGKTPEDLAI
ncbi:H-NS histone family protein [Tropicibacter sp. R15_0]|nr:H-NS histone family protein [Tropicibacter sp. R15_0]